jgi:hypothetical protein
VRILDRKSVDSGILKYLEAMDEEGTGRPLEEIDGIESGMARQSQPIGEIVGILQRSQRDYVACLAEEDEELLRHSNFSRSLSAMTRWDFVKLSTSYCPSTKKFRVFMKCEQF